MAHYPHTFLFEIDIPKNAIKHDDEETGGKKLPKNAYRIVHGEVKNIKLISCKTYLGDRIIPKTLDNHTSAESELENDSRRKSDKSKGFFKNLFTKVTPYLKNAFLVSAVILAPIATIFASAMSGVAASLLLASAAVLAVYGIAKVYNSTDKQKNDKVVPLKKKEVKKSSHVTHIIKAPKPIVHASKMHKQPKPAQIHARSERASKTPSMAKMRG